MTLSSQLGLPSTYHLDRLDLSVRTTLDGVVQAHVTRELRRLAKPSSVAAAGGLIGPHLLGSGNPAGIVYSFVLDRARAGRESLACRSGHVQGTPRDQSGDEARTGVDGEAPDARDLPGSDDSVAAVFDELQRPDARPGFRRRAPRPSSDAEAPRGHLPIGLA